MKEYSNFFNFCPPPLLIRRVGADVDCIVRGADVDFIVGIDDCEGLIVPQLVEPVFGDQVANGHATHELPPTPYVPIGHW